MNPGIASAKVNLAPELYQSHQRDKRHKRIATSLGIFCSVVALIAVVVCGIILAAQSVGIKLLRSSITSDENKLQTYPDLVTAATSQEHLASWKQLNAQKIFLSRFFTVLQTAAPQGIAISGLNIDPKNNLQATGTAQSYTLAAKFAQALSASNTQLGPGASPTQQPYFTNVQLSNLNQEKTGGVDFQLTTTMSGQVTTNGQ